MIRKSVQALVLLCRLRACGTFLWPPLAIQFLPDDDQGYLFISMQLPNAASQGRRPAASRDVEKVLSARLRFSTTPALLVSTC